MQVTQALVALLVLASIQLSYAGFVIDTIINNTPKLVILRIINTEGVELKTLVINKNSTAWVTIPLCTEPSTHPHGTLHATFSQATSSNPLVIRKYMMVHAIRTHNSEPDLAALTSSNTGRRSSWNEQTLQTEQALEPLPHITVLIKYNGSATAYLSS